ncbi:MBL fold metallo-hydrolase [Erysipelothrix sp. HDW6C]|nr:MBL fold metallo-hydrolase [Erysipelothrix sp. HDW6C]
MKYALLASGSKGNACLIEAGNQLLLIDCGTTKRYLTQSFMALGKDFSDVDAVLITHDHSDHTSQLKHFRSSPIYCPSPIEDVYQVQPYEDFMIGDFHILPIKTSHDDAYSVGYVIRYGEEKLVYITDTGYIRDQDLPLIHDADYYIMESNHDPEILMGTNRPYAIKRRILSDVGHLSNDDAGILLSRIIGDQTKSIFLAHLSEQANTEALAIDTVRTHIGENDIKIVAGKQYEIVKGGHWHEE